MQRPIEKRVRRLTAPAEDVLSLRPSRQWAQHQEELAAGFEELVHSQEQDQHWLDSAQPRTVSIGRAQFVRKEYIVANRSTCSAIYPKREAFDG